jgi:hypothetical protein
MVNPHLLGRRQFLHLAAGVAALPIASRIAAGFLTETAQK